MALEENFAQIRATKEKRKCAYMMMYLALTPEDQKALDKAWAKGYSANEILMALRQEGIKSSNESIRQHRIGACPCPKKK